MILYCMQALWSLITYGLRSGESSELHGPNAISELYHGFDDKDWVKKSAKASDDCDKIRDLLHKLTHACELKANEIIQNKQGKSDWLYNDDGSVNQDSYFWKKFVCQEPSKSGDKKFITHKCCWRYGPHIHCGADLCRLKRIPNALKEISDSEIENKNFIKRYLTLLYIWGGISKDMIPKYAQKGEWRCAFSAQQPGKSNDYVCCAVFGDDYDTKRHTINFSLCNLILIRLFDPSYTFSANGGPVVFSMNDKQLEVLQNAHDENKQLEVLRNTHDGNKQQEVLKTAPSYKESTISDTLKLCLIWFLICMAVVMIFTTKIDIEES